MSLRLTPYLETLTIQTKDATTERINLRSDFAWAQREYIAEIERQFNTGRPIRVIILKARQLGMSTITEGILFWWSFFFNGIDSLVIAHENESTSSLFEKTKLMWETWPYERLFNLKHGTQRRLTWTETRSSIRIATAKNVQTGRGRTLYAVHASECAFYPDPKTLFLGLNQTVPQKPGSIIVLESTANGIGNWFHEQWILSEQGESDYVPLFFPFYRHPEYRKHTTLASSLELTAEERQLIRIGADYENVEWRRWAIRNLCQNDEQTFAQEYPATPEEAFIATGRNVFPLKKLDECYDPARGHRGMLVGRDELGNDPRYVHDPFGPLIVYKAPSTDHRTDRYFIAGDPSETIAGDPACIQVINRQTMEQVAVWHGQIDPISFAREMMLLGRWYHNAALCPEVEGGGQATVATMLNAGYPNVWQHRWADKAPGKVSNSYGWATNFQRKSWAVSALRYLIGDNSITIHDKKTYNQLRNYVVLDNGEMGNADLSIHDDAVMALAIAVVASQADGPFSEWQDKSENVVDMFGLEEASLR